MSLVGFQFLDTAVSGRSIPFHRDFDEVNLRFYVRGVEGRGVVFIKEIVPRRAIAWVARLLYQENYVTAPMQHTIERSSGRLSAGYSWRWRGRSSFLAIEGEGEPSVPPADSAEAFILEHYWGYTRLRGGGSAAYRVEHPAWRVWRVLKTAYEVDGDALYGAGLSALLRRAPVSAILAEGSEVAVFRAQRS